MRIAIPSVLLSVYLIFSLIVPLRAGNTVKILLAILLLAVGMKFPFYQYAGGSFFNPELPYPVQLLCETLYCSLIILFAIAAVKDIAHILLKIFSFRLPFTCGVRHTIFLAAALASGTWSVVQAMKVPDIRHVEVAIPDLLEALEGFTIIQLTDLHIGPLLKQDWLQNVVKKTNSLDADLIVLTGDMVDGLPSQRLSAIKPLADLKAKYGVYGIAGNHEYYYDAAAWIKTFNGMGLHILENTHASIAGKLILGGVTDPAARRFGFSGPDIKKTFSGAPDGIKILLSHRPSTSGIPAAGIALQLSGHTHGGHLFFLKPLIAHFNNGFVSGMYETGEGGKLYVSRGTGLWNGFSCRLAVPSEITALHLHRQKPSNVSRKKS